MIACNVVALMCNDFVSATFGAVRIGKNERWNMLVVLPPPVYCAPFLGELCVISEL
jgi:hypothetical protein